VPLAFAGHPERKFRDLPTGGKNRGIGGRQAFCPVKVLMGIILGVGIKIKSPP